MQHFEKLGSFYLGKTIDSDSGKRQNNYMLYDSKDMTTHALCVGMTGSGKTGLCIGVLEEAAIDGIPAIVIDPKGDMTNLCLSFPDLSPADFTPWVSAEDAEKKGMNTEEYGAAQAELWRKGLGEWDQDGERIRAMLNKTDFEIYTPGSTAGSPLSIVKLFALPHAGILSDAEALNELASGTAASLLGLIGVDADPIKSREHILLSNILITAWGSGENLDLAGLIHMIQKPKFNQIGVMSLDDFYPDKDRFSLALQFNNLLASPGFASWMQGEPLDIDRLLYTQEGKPKISILSISHLNDAERMFFVSLVLNQMVSWVRIQPGTSSLRALLYMDEIFGYFPPVANPPSKAPLLTLLKQARAYGLGVMLTTQNPMDLDYKGLSNMGTWFIGRLQTDRDRDRLLDGLEGAALSSGHPLNRGKIGELISSLSSRKFLMNNVHEDQPVLFETRWCLSYLRGPLNRPEIQQLTKGKTWASTTPVVVNKPVTPPVANIPVSTSQDTVPILPDTVTQTFIPYRGSSTGIVYRPSLTGLVSIHYNNAKTDFSVSEEVIRLAPISEGLITVDWSQSQVLDLSIDDLETTGAEGSAYLPLPAACSKKTSYTVWERELVDYTYRNSSLQVYKNDHLKKTSRPGETERDFKVRLQQESREARDEAIDKLRTTYAKKAATLEERIRKAEQAVEREKDQAKDAAMQTALSVGSTLLGALLGRKKISSTSLSKAATAARGFSRQAKQKGDVDRSKETVTTYKDQLAELEQKMQEDIDAISLKMEAKSEDTTSVEIRPLKRDCVVRAIALTWEPLRKEVDGSLEKAW